MIEDGGRLVYFIRSGEGPIKIGSSDNPRKRMATLQSANWERLTLLGTCEGGYLRERELHALLGAHRLEGEWFAPTDQVLLTMSECLGRDSVEFGFDPVAAGIYRQAPKGLPVRGWTAPLQAGGTQVPMIRNQRCSVCRSNLRPEVDEWLVLGMTLRQIMRMLPEDVGFSLRSVRSHGRKHLLLQV